MDSASTAGATPASAPVYPVFAAVAVGMTGRTVYQVIDAVGGIFEAAGAVFEGSPDAPGTLIALLPPSENAAVRAVELGLQAQTIEAALRIGVDAVEVHTKKEQDARWQQVIDSAVKLEKAARTGEAIAGEAIGQLTRGAAATQALHVGDDTYLLLTGVHELSAVPDQAVAPAAVPEEPPASMAPAIAVETSPDVQPATTKHVQAGAEAVRAPVASEPVGAEPPAAPSPQPAAEQVGNPTITAPPVETIDPPTDEPVAAPTPVADEPVVVTPATGDAGPVSAPDDLYPHAPEPPPEEPVSVTPVAATAGPPATGPSMHPTARWDGPLVGREVQLTDLRARFDRVVADRSGAVVLITGEPGSGRTRLVAEFAASLDDANVLHVSCAPADGGGARWPVAAVVEALAGLDPLAPAEPARARLADLFAGAPDAEALITHLSAMLALEGASDLDHIRWALRRLLEAAAGGVPTVLHVDDADRAGSGFVRLIADVATGARDTPVFVAITTNRETDNLPAIRLSSLDRAAIETLIGHLLGATEDGVVGALAARMPGLPFAIEQSLAMVTETGTLAPGNGRWMPLADLSRVPWPDTTVGAIRQRLQTLPPHELAVLGMAAVAGEQIATAPLLEVVPVDARPGVPAYLEDLVARGYLVAGGDGAFRFRHPLLREATMTGVPEWAQAVTHERFGRHLESTAGERVWRLADAIGSHLEASCRLRPDAPATDRDDALTFLTWAATAAADQGDLDGAARLERRAATLTDDDPARRAELLYLAAEHMATAAPDRPADREIAEAALAASVAGDDIDWRVRLLRAKLRTLAGHEDALEGARASADEAIAAFGEEELGWALANAWALRGLVHAARAQHGLVADDLQRAADNAAAAGRAPDETTALRGAAAALLDGPESVAEAEARCRSFLERVTGPIAEDDIRGILAVLAARRGAFDDAKDRHRRVDPFAGRARRRRRHGDRLAPWRTGGGARRSGRRRRAVDATRARCGDTRARRPAARLPRRFVRTRRARRRSSRRGARARRGRRGARRRPHDPGSLANRTRTRDGASRPWRARRATDPRRREHRRADRFDRPARKRTGLGGRCSPSGGTARRGRAVRAPRAPVVRAARRHCTSGRGRGPAQAGAGACIAEPTTDRSPRGARSGADA